MIATDQEFHDTTIMADGGIYTRCKFTRCRMVFSAAIPGHFEGCNFHECAWEFSGAALVTVQVMSAMYHGGLRDVVEKIFESIRRPRTSPPAPGSMRVN